MPKKKIVTVQDIALRNTEDCIPYEDNPRLNDGAVDGVAMSIEKYGFNIPIILDDDDIVVTGHTRLKAAKKLGMLKVPTIKADHLTEDEIRAFRLADNRVAENATWDDDALARELTLLEASGFDLDITGFNREEIDCLTMEVNADCLDDLNQDDICGTIEDGKAHIVANKRVSISVGTYKLFVTKEEFHSWEKEQLAAHGSKADIVRNIAAVLGLHTAEFDDKT